MMNAFFRSDSEKRSAGVSIVFYDKQLHKHQFNANQLYSSS